MNIITWIQDNIETIIQIITGSVTVASLIVRLTPTLKDDSALLTIVKFLGRYIALNRSTDDEALRNQPKNE